MNTLVIMKASISSASSVPLRFKGFHSWTTLSQAQCRLLTTDS